MTEMLFTPTNVKCQSARKRVRDQGINGAFCMWNMRQEGPMHICRVCTL